MDESQSGAVGNDDHTEQGLDRMQDELYADLRLVRVVELRCFSGLGVSEAAQALGLSEATLKRDWALARAWLLRELKGTDHGP